MSGFFLAGSVMSIIALAATGAVNGHTMVMFAILIPAAVVGYVLSRGLNCVWHRNDCAGWRSASQRWAPLC